MLYCFCNICVLLVDSMVFPGQCDILVRIVHVAEIYLFLINYVALFPTMPSTDVCTIPHLTNAPNIRTFYSIAYFLNWTSYQKYQCIVPMYFYFSIQLCLLILPITFYFVVFCSMTYTRKKCCKKKKNHTFRFGLICT